MERTGPKISSRAMRMSLGHVGEHGGAHVVAAVEVLRQGRGRRSPLRAFGDAGFDQGLDLVELHLADHGAELDGFVGAGIADGDLVGGPLAMAFDLVQPVGGDEHAAGRVAGLAAIAEHVA